MSAPGSQKEHKRGLSIMTSLQDSIMVGISCQPDFLECTAADFEGVIIDDEDLSKHLRKKSKKRTSCTKK